MKDVARRLHNTVLLAIKPFAKIYSSYSWIMKMGSKCRMSTLTWGYSHVDWSKGLGHAVLQYPAFFLLKQENRIWQVQLWAVIRWIGWRSETTRSQRSSLCKRNRSSLGWKNKANPSKKVGVETSYTNWWNILVKPLESFKQNPILS